MLNLFQLAAFNINGKKNRSVSSAPLSGMSITIGIQLNHDIFITYFSLL